MRPRRAPPEGEKVEPIIHPLEVRRLRQIRAWLEGTREDNPTRAELREFHSWVSLEIESALARESAAASGHRRQSSVYTGATVVPRDRWRRISATRIRKGSTSSRQGNERRFSLPHRSRRRTNRRSWSDRGTSAPYASDVNHFTDAERKNVEDREMQSLVTISVLDDEGEEIDTVSASADTPEEAFELARQQLDLEPA